MPAEPSVLMSVPQAGRFWTSAPLDLLRRLFRTRFGGIGIVILVVIFILFGHRLPSVMRSLGRGVVEFKEGMSGTATPDENEKVERRDV